MPRRSAPEQLHIDQSDRVRIPLAAERLRVGTRTRRTGVVRVRTLVERRVAVVDPPLRRQDVHIARRRIDRFVDVPPEVRREGDTLIVPVVEEIVVTRLKVVEEVRITMRRSIERRPQRVPLRRTRAIIDRFASNEHRR